MAIHELLISRRDLLLKQLQSMEEPSASERSVKPAPTGRSTIKDLALEALRAYPVGLDTNQIIAEIKEKHGQDIARSSMSPQLSRLKADGEIEQVGHVWRIVSLKNSNKINKAGDEEFDDLLG